MTNCFTLKQKFRDSQIVIITNFVVVSNVGLKRVDCRKFVYSILCHLEMVYYHVLRKPDLKQRKQKQLKIHKYSQ